MLAPAQLQSVEARVRAVEERAGVQVVVSVIEQADVYHGLRWRAFAFGAAGSGAVVALGGMPNPAWLPAPAHFGAIATVLGVGLLFALAATLSPAVARHFLEPERAEAELRQRAAVIFLERELFATRNRTGVLLLAGRFERRAVVMADRGFRGRVTEEEWHGVERSMRPDLRAGRPVEAALAGLAALERLLVGKGFVSTPDQPNELPDRPLTGSGSP
jgi:putative membrane protein